MEDLVAEEGDRISLKSPKVKLIMLGRPKGKKLKINKNVDI